MLVFTICLLSACGEPKAPTHDDIIKEIMEEEEEKETEHNAQSNQDESDLQIMIAGERVSLPFDFNVLLQKGYTLVDSEQVQKIKNDVNEDIFAVLLTNDSEKMDTMYGSPYIDVDIHVGNNSNDVKVTSINIHTVEKKFASVNGFGWNDKMADFINSINHDYEELVGNKKDNLNSGNYIIEYKFSEVIMDVYSVDGLISLIDITAIQ